MAEIQEARRTISGIAFRTPLVRLNTTESDAEIYLKLENLQPIGSLKIRGSANVMKHLPKEQLARGVITASAGNMGLGVALHTSVRALSRFLSSSFAGKFGGKKNTRLITNSSDLMGARVRIPPGPPYRTFF